MTDHQSLSVADLKDIQAGPVVQVPTRCALFVFFAIKNVDKFRILLHELIPLITTSYSARGIKDEVSQAKAKSELATIAGLNVSFSQQGLSKLLSNADANDEAFKEGQFPRANNLGDDTAQWIPQFKANSIDGLFEITGYPATYVQNIVAEKIKNSPQVGDKDPALVVIFEHYGQVRPGKEKGHEHFGFQDGISQPFVNFEDDATQKRQKFPGQTVVNPGVLVIGQPGDPIIRAPWTKNGSLLAFRQLKQLVPEFNAFLKGVVLSSILDPRLPGVTANSQSQDLQQRIDFLGARLMGRWKSGLPVVLSPKQPGKFPVDDPTIGQDPQRNNNFDYGARTESPRQQFLCPFAAHTRKAGPRTDLPLAADEQHAILRAGIAYGPEVSPAEYSQNKTLQERGLLFVSYQSQLAAGFEFIQQSWVDNIHFTFNTGTAVPGFDPIIGQKQGQVRTMTGYDADDLSKTLSLPTQFVISQGGQYFFLPSITTLNQISKTPTPTPPAPTPPAPTAPTTSW